ncbi:MAG: hypothetical protein R3B09_26045 [Nannocystaceae bacterium]
MSILPALVLAALAGPLPADVVDTRDAVDSSDPEAALAPRLRLKCLLPNVEQLDRTTIGPGDTLTLIGCGFGEQKGGISLAGDFPGGAATLVVASWTDQEIKVKMPADYSGAADQTATIWIDPVGLDPRSTKQTIAFEAVKVEVLLSKYDLSGPSWAVSEAASGPETFDGSLCLRTACYQWKVDPANPLVIPGGDFEVHFKAALKHGWVYSRSTFWQDNGADFSLLGPVPKPPAPDGKNLSNGASIDFRVRGSLWAKGQWIKVKVGIWVKGPRGVPLR